MAIFISNKISKLAPKPQNRVRSPSYHGFTPTFGDGRKRNTLGSAWTPREEGRALAARDRLPRIHDSRPDGTTIPPASTPPRGARRHDAAPPLAVRRATRPRRAPGAVSAGRDPGPGPHGAPAGSGRARDRGARGQTSGVAPFAAG